jgi:hypothetical protein
LIRFEATAADSVTAFERAIELYRVVGDTLGVAHALVDVSRELTVQSRSERGECQ